MPAVALVDHVLDAADIELDTLGNSLYLIDDFAGLTRKDAVAVMKWSAQSLLRSAVGGGKSKGMSKTKVSK